MPIGIGSKVRDKLGDFAGVGRVIDLYDNASMSAHGTVPMFTVAWGRDNVADRMADEIEPVGSAQPRGRTTEAVA